MTVLKGGLKIKENKEGKQERSNDRKKEVTKVKQIA